MMKRLAVLSVLAFSFAACGGSDDQAASASEGDAFCSLAQVAKDDNDALDGLDITDPTAVRVGLSTALDSLSALAAEAPADIEATVNKLLTNEEKLEDLLEANDFDFVEMAQSDEGKALLADESLEVPGDELDTYLNEKCGIEIDDTVPTDDTVATDDTIGSDVTIGSDISIDLGEGEDAINRFLDFFELGTGTELTDEQRACVVDELRDSITGDELNEAISGNPSEEATQALGLAFIGCDIDVAG